MKFVEKKDGDSVGMAVIDSPKAMSNAVYEMVHHAMEKYGQNNGMQCCEIAGSAALGAILNLALMACKKPEHVAIGRIPKGEAHKVFMALRTETLVFASLIVAHQFHEVKKYDADHMTLVAEFGTGLFGKALAQWQKLYPDLNIEDYLEPGAADIAKKELNNPENHFDAEKSFNRAFVLRNNGTIN